MKILIELDVDINTDIEGQVWANISHPLLKGKLSFVRTSMEEIDKALYELHKDVPKLDPTFTNLISSALRVKDSFLEVKKQFNK